MNLLTSCKTATKYIAVDNYCTLGGTIRANDEDKKALKASSVSKEFIEKIVNSNDLFAETCLMEKNETSNCSSGVCSVDNHSSVENK